jgi:hypothetical protein
MHAKNDTRATTAKARETFLKSFEDAVDPDRKRAGAARRAHFTALAYKASRARSVKKGA